MKEIILKIPENKVAFFMELIKQLGFEVSEEAEVSDEQKNIVRERISTANEEEMISWKQARKQFNVKKKS